MRWKILLSLLMSVACAHAQENQLQADFRGEHDRFVSSCTSLKNLAGCAQVLFTDHPLHIAVGSIAPQNGFGGGPAFVAHYTPNENWRLSWDVDAVATGNASWRAGAYMKLIHTPQQVIRVQVGGGAAQHKSNLAVHEYSLFNVYAQAISLNKLYFFGLGPATPRAGRSIFRERETIAGANAIVPIFRPLNVSLLGEINGRFPAVEGNHDKSTPSINTLYTDAAAPGLASQPSFIQFAEGLRIRPVFFGDHLQLNYLANFQQYAAPSDTTYSFRRFNFDLGHTIPLYRTTVSSASRDTNGPDECATAPGAKCPPIPVSRNNTGSIGIRLLISESIANAGSTVPFYMQPTLGGSDVNGAAYLGSYEDYRFRGPNLLLLRESLEHSVWGPFGASFVADQGKVALTRGDVAFDHLAHSFSAGLTLRAGGLPEVFLMFSWGGGEGTHTNANVNTSLLGGSARPSIF